jgi:DNA modification methylase
MKPVEMIENQLKISSNNNSPVLDLFGGSGSTLIACEKTGRKCYMMELDPKYCDVIIKRWQDFTGKKATMTGDTFDDVAAARGIKING